MGSEKYRTFKSEHPSTQRNVRSGCVGILMCLPSVGLFELISLGFLYWFGLKKNKDYCPFNNELIYNTVDVGENNILLRKNNWSRSRSDHRMSVTNIERIIARDVYVDDALSNKLMKVYEFHHKYGSKPLLCYDIEDQSGFEELLMQKGIKIEHVN